MKYITYDKYKKFKKLKIKKSLIIGIYKIITNII